MPKEKRHQHKGRKAFYKDVTVTHNKIVYRRNGLILKYGSLTTTHYPLLINLGSVINCYDEQGKYIRKFQCLINGKPTKNYFGFKGTRITAQEFFEIQEKNKPDNKPIATETNIAEVIKKAFEVLRKKDYFNDIKSNYARGTKLWCNDVALKTSERLRIAPEIINETLKNIYDE